MTKIEKIVLIAVSSAILLAAILVPLISYLSYLIRQRIIFLTKYDKKYTN